MNYIEHYPKNQLSHFIEKIWYCSVADFTANYLTIPLVNHELVFNFSENYKIRKTEDNELTIENPVAWINGLQSKAYFSYSSGRHEMLGVLFKANGLKAFLKYHSIVFSENFIDAKLVFGKPIQTLINQIQDTSLVFNKIALTENFLLANLIEFNYPAYLSYSMNQLSETLGSKGSIINICNQLSISNKSLIEAFKKHIGINPVKYSHLQAINKALLLLSKDPKQSLTKVAHNLNFYDQSHFTGLFKSITSLTPSQYSSHIINKQVDIGSPNFIAIEG